MLRVSENERKEDEGLSSCTMSLRMIQRMKRRNEILEGLIPALQGHLKKWKNDVPGAIADEMAAVIETLENIKKGRSDDFEKRRIARVVAKNRALRPKTKILRV